MSKKYIFILLAAVLSLSSLVFICFVTNLYINASGSLPGSVFLGIPFRTLERGDQVVFTHHVSPHTILKRIVGVPGDRIMIKDGQVWVMQCVGKVREYLNNGRSVHPIQEGVIPDDQLFLMGTHPKSFDSRYQEFGLVSLSSIIHKAICVW